MSTLPFNPVTGNPYTGENIGALLSQAAGRGYSSMQFAGFHQWKNSGRVVKKGEKALYIRLMKSKKVIKNGIEDTVTFCSGAAVFAIEQTEMIQALETVNA